MFKQKIVLAVTGASGALYAQSLLSAFTQLSNQIDAVGVVFSNNAKVVWEHELNNQSWKDFNFTEYNNTDFFAPFASGSAQYSTMFICPCSMGVLGRIAHGVSNDLITRAADVALKERRKLILIVRETPYSLIHLNNMTLLTQAGAIICPASPSFYSRPHNFEQLAATVINRALDLAGLHLPHTYRWGDKDND